MFRQFTSLYSRNNITVRITTTASAADSFTTPFLQNSSPLRFFCDDVPNPQSLTVDYLTNSCGLSPKAALEVSKRLLLKSTTGPDSVLSLLNSYGFTKPQISKIVTVWPSVLRANPDKSLRPKLVYFSNMDMAGPDLAKMISARANILMQSLENTIIPSVNYLRSLVGTDKGVTIVLKKCSWGSYNAEHILGPNITILLDHGVPQPNISNFLILAPQALYRSSDVIKEKVLQLVSMGFCPSSMMFLHGLHVLLGMKKPKWDEKMAVYKGFGWSEDEVLFLFKKQPSTMSASVKRITLSLNFFLNDLKWSREDISRHASVILLSLEKRVIPRCHVLQILFSKNLITKAGMAQGLRHAEDSFLKKYVCKYHHVEPDLLKLYQNNMGTPGLLVEAKEGPELPDTI